MLWLEEMSSNYKIILASASPRRKELLSRFVSDFEIIPANIDEKIPDNVDVDSVPLHIAIQKAHFIKENYNKIDSNTIIISADTCVIHNNKIFGKPKDSLEAKYMLTTLNGETHKVITGVCCLIIDKNKKIEFSETTNVKFARLDESIIDKYIASKEYTDKAGAYAIQGLGSILVEKIDGCYDNVVGLPVAKVIRKLMNENIILF